MIRVVEMHVKRQLVEPGQDIDYWDALNLNISIYSPSVKFYSQEIEKPFSEITHMLTKIYRLEDTLEDMKLKQALKELHVELFETVIDYLANPQTDADQFQERYTTLFEAAKLEFKDQEDIWDKYVLPVVKGLAGALAALTVIPALVATATDKGFVGTFTHTSKHQQILESYKGEIQKQRDLLAPKADPKDEFDPNRDYTDSGPS